MVSAFASERLFCQVKVLDQQQIVLCSPKIDVDVLSTTHGCVDRIFPGLPSAPIHL